MAQIPNADGSAPTAPGWFDNLFSSVQKLGSLAGTATAWKELVDPIKAVQQPTLGTGSAGPVPVPTSATKPAPISATGSSNIVWYLVGGLAFLFIVVLVSRRA